MKIMVEKEGGLEDYLLFHIQKLIDNVMSHALAFFCCLKMKYIRCLTEMYIPRQV